MVFGERLHDFVKRPLGGFLRRPPPHLVRVQLRRQIQIRIQRVQALQPLSPIAEPLHPNLSKDRFQPPFLPPARLPHLPLRVPHRNGRLTRSPQLQVRLIEPSQQLPLQLAVRLTMGLVGHEKGLHLGKLLPRRRELILGL